MEVTKRFEIWVQIVENTNIGTKQTRKLVTKRLGSQQARLVYESVKQEIEAVFRKEEETPRMVTDLEHLQQASAENKEVDNAKG